MKNSILKLLSFLFIGGFFLLMPSISSYAFTAPSYSEALEKASIALYVERNDRTYITYPEYYQINFPYVIDVQFSSNSSHPLWAYFSNRNEWVSTGFPFLVYEGSTFLRYDSISSFAAPSSILVGSDKFGIYSNTDFQNNVVVPSDLYSYNPDLPDIKVSAVLTNNSNGIADLFGARGAILSIFDNPTDPLNHYDFYKITISGEKKTEDIQKNYLEFLDLIHLQDYSDSIVKIKVTPYKGTEYGNTIQLFIDLNNNAFTKYTGTPVKPNVTVPTPEGDKQVPVEATTNITYYYSSSTEFITSNFNDFVFYQQTVNVIDDSVENITNNNYEYFVTNNYYYTYNYDIDIDIDVSGNQLGIKNFINGFPSFGEGILNRLTELGFPKWLVVLVISCFGLVVGALVVKIIRSFLPF